MAQYLMGLDLGGKKIRCLLLDVDSGAVISARRPLHHRMTAGFGYNLDTLEVWRLFGDAAHEVMIKIGARPQDVLAVSTTGMRHGSVLVDARGEALLATPTRDARGSMQSLQLASERGREFHERTGHFPAPLFTVSRLLWIADSEPELLSRAHAVLALSDWLAYRLSGKMVVEPSVASESGLFEIGPRRWADDLIGSLGLPRHLFPEIAASGSVLGPLLEDAAHHLGLLPGIAVVTGGGDTQCGLLGAGVIDSGQMGIIAGSTMPLQWVVNTKLIDPETRVWTSHHVVEERWTLESNGGPTGDLIEWLAGVIYSGLSDPVAALFAEASQSAVAPKGSFQRSEPKYSTPVTCGCPLGISHCHQCWWPRIHRAGVMCREQLSKDWLSRRGAILNCCKKRRKTNRSNRFDWRVECRKAYSSPSFSRM